MYIRFTLTFQKTLRKIDATMPRSILEKVVFTKKIIEEKLRVKIQKLT